mmetsp:Transcript_34641/g.67033  ORF Transcript_34641/g.67033 Transcript_34641/m.67033 type:complete len:172 (-) Transcript_34641:311-826(-)
MHGHGAMSKKGTSVIDLSIRSNPSAVSVFAASSSSFWSCPARFTPAILVRFGTEDSASSSVSSARHFRLWVLGRGFAEVSNNSDSLAGTGWGPTALDHTRHCEEMHPVWHKRRKVALSMGPIFFLAVHDIPLVSFSIDVGCGIFFGYASAKDGFQSVAEGLFDEEIHSTCD